MNTSKKSDTMKYEKLFAEYFVQKALFFNHAIMLYLG